jgi:hypothetical protein
MSDCFFMRNIALFSFLFCFFFAFRLSAQQPVVSPEGPSMTMPDATKSSDSVLVTVILKHQQNKNLAEIRRVLEVQGFWEAFPPPDMRVVSWNIAMGMGHIITLQMPAGAVRRLNLALENGAWGAFDTQVYLSYNYQPIWQEYIEKREDAKEEKKN